MGNRIITWLFRRKMTTPNKFNAVIQSNALNNQALNTIEKIVGDTCFCKLRSFCQDKTSGDCLKYRNIYQEFMKSRK